MRIFIDIETLPTSREDIRSRVCGDIAPPGNYKKEETIAQWWASEGDKKRQEAIETTALNGTWGEILCIGFAVDDGDVRVIMEPAETLTLPAFAETLATEFNATTGVRNWEYHATWVGHNIADFDLRFLWQRFLIRGIKLPFCIPVGKPSYNQGPYFYDTMKEWAGWKGGIKQTDLELAFGLTRTDPLVNGGADVYRAYQESRRDDIAQHCREDVRLLREIYKRMVA